MAQRYFVKDIINLKRTNGSYTVGYSIVIGALQDLSAYISMLHPAEKEKYEQLRHPERKKTYLLGRIAAKHALSMVSPTQSFPDIHIDSGIFCFPVARHKHGNIQVSISHTNNIGIAIAYQEEHPASVDIEYLYPDSASHMQAALNQQEIARAQLLRLPLNILYAIGWTAKEALSKIIRTGLTLDFDILEIDSIVNARGLIICTFKNFKQYKTYTFIGRRYALTLALPLRTMADLSRLRQTFLKVIIDAGI